MKNIFNHLIKLLVCLSIAQNVYAASEAVSVNVTFVDAIAISEVNPLSFGLVNSGMADNQTIIISPEDTVTDTNSNQLGGTPEAAEVTVTATSGQSISISVSDITPGSYYALSNPTCKYGSNASSGCTSQSHTSLASGKLLIGMTLTKNATPAVVGADNGTFNVNVIYN